VEGLGFDFEISVLRFCTWFGNLTPPSETVIFVDQAVNVSTLYVMS